MVTMHGRWSSLVLAMLGALFGALTADAANTDRWKPLPPAEDVWFQADLMVHYHVVPNDLLDKAYSVHGRLEGISPGIEIALKKEGFHLIGLFAVTFVTTPDQVWLELEEPKTAAVWVHQDLWLITFGMVFAYEFAIAPAFGIMPGVGFTPVFVMGDATQTPTLGHPDDPIEERTPNPNHPGSPLNIRPKKMMSPDLSVRVRLRPTERFFFSVDFGWRTYVYTGMSVGFKVP